MENLFESVFKQSDGTTKVTIPMFFLVLGISLLMGIIISIIAKYKGKSTKSFYVANAILPAAVAMVIMLVNGNIGVGVAIAGAFGLVRFRSAQGSAREIAIIFISMRKLMIPMKNKCLIVMCYVVDSRAKHFQSLF